ncbi:MAG: Hsp20/alpha crystallin family protein [Burkholderiaceae bacterium]
MNDNKTSMTKKEDESMNQPAAALIPPVDVIEDASGITVFADLPGVPKDKITLSLEKDSLTIAGDVLLDTPEGMESSHVEVRQPRYRRMFSLSRDLDTEKASAEFKNGVLKLRIPKAEHTQPRRIEVKVS